MALTSKRVLKLLRRGEPGRHLDQRGLYLVIGSRTNAHWEKRYQLDGREHYTGLGSAFVFGLAAARERARRVSEQLADKIDPIAQKRAAKAERIAAAAKAKTFGEVAQDFFAAHSRGWGHRKHIAQWRSSVLGLTMNGAPAEADYCKILRPLPVQSIDTPIILQVLRPIWESKPATMSRVRARIAAVIDYATASKYRSGDNPAAANLISKVLPVNGKNGKHFAAVNYREIPTLVAELRAREGMAARCLEFLVYTSARSTEAREAVWSEINLAEATWTIPASRMKANRSHIVPLAPEVIELLQDLPREGDGDRLIFIGPRPGVPLTDLSLMKLMRRLGRSEVVHGFRSSFSDWAHERTVHSNHAIEISLAHAVGDATAQAYQRGPMLEKRRKLMDAWATYCCTRDVRDGVTDSSAPVDEDKVVSIGRGRA